ncbi:MAG: DinB family protein [Deltaproteobacteria bacterium]|nr:DinB family protein [Candidatus Deferrimicrobiaceae bacterium]
MAANRMNRPGETQARRLEDVCEQLATLLDPSGAPRRMRDAGDNEWSVMQVLGHMVEMIPYWLGHCHTLIAATGEPPVFGRGLDTPERLAGIERGASGDPKELLGLLNDEVKAAARAIREMSDADRGKKGIHIRLGEFTVAATVERFIVAHAEEHLEQIRAALQG